MKHIGTFGHALYHSPVGELCLVSGGDSLLMCDWTASARHQSNLSRLGMTTADLPAISATAPIVRATEWLEAYFSRAALSEMPEMPALNPVGTPFQRDVWRALLSLRRGTTVSYTRLAAMAAHPSAVRAVASAIASNPLSIFIPCHLVTRSDGSTGNYAGGPATKRLLIDLEQSSNP